MTARKVVLDHERLEVYRKSLDFVELAEALAAQLGRRQRHLSWQLQRCASSIPLNIAEGVGRFRPADKAHFFAVAIGSAGECAAILDIAERLKLGDPRLRADMRLLVISLIQMLNRLAQAVRSRQHRK